MLYNLCIVRKESNGKVIRAFSMILQFSLFLLVPICGLSALGYFLDRHFGTKWIMIVLFFIGAIAGFQNIFRFAMSIMADKKDSDTSHESSGDSEK